MSTESLGKPYNIKQRNWTNNVRKVEFYKDKYHYIVKKYKNNILIETELLLTEEPALKAGDSWLFTNLEK